MSLNNAFLVTFLDFIEFIALNFIGKSLLTLLYGQEERTSEKADNQAATFL